MHTSYLSLAVFALGAAAAPSFPKPNGDPFAGSFPFFPPGSSSTSDEDGGLSDPVPAYMAAMEAVHSAQAGAYSTPESTNAPVTVPPVPASHHAMQTPMPEHKKPMAAASSSHPTQAMMSSFISKASPTPTHRPMQSMGIHEGHVSSSKLHATPSSSATPSASASAVPSSNPGLFGLGPVVQSVPIVGPMLGPLIGG